MTDEELKGLFDANAAETRAHLADLRLHFDITAEGLRHDIQLVAENVIQVEEKLEREAADIRAELRGGFAETHELIRFSYGELDQRVRVVESGQHSVE